MNPPRILLIGKNGQVGWELHRALSTLGELVAVDYPEINLAEPDSIRCWIERVNPEVIANAAAYTAVDKAESEPELAMELNAAAPGILAEASRKRDALLVHYSTEYVFDGTKGGPYVETDPPNPLSVYGCTKLAGDESVVDAGGRYLIFRTSWVYGARGRNFLHTIRRLAAERPELRIVDDQIGSPTSSRMIAEATAQVLVQVLRRDDQEIRELYNLSNNGQTSWCGFARAILERLVPSFDLAKLYPIRTEDYPLPAKRPKNSVLSKEKLAQDFGITPPTWEESLERVCEELNACRIAPATVTYKSDDEAG